MRIQRDHDDVTTLVVRATRRPAGRSANPHRRSAGRGAAGRSGRRQSPRLPRGRFLPRALAQSVADGRTRSGWHRAVGLGLAVLVVAIGLRPGRHSDQPAPDAHPAP